jgi:putative holliday junction resolvase
MHEPLRGTLLGLDFGQRRIGVAVGEWETRMANPLEVLAQPDIERRLDRLAELIQTWQAKALVVGVPHTPDGEPARFAPHCRRFGQQLHARFHLPVFEVDEAFSSSEAETQLKGAGHFRWEARKREIDAWAACLILQQFLGEDDIAPVF